MSIGPSLLAVLRKRPQLRRGGRGWLGALFLVSMTIFLFPLFADLFFTIPWPVRKRLGQVLFLGLLGLGIHRLLTVRAGDSWPAPAGESEGDRNGRAGRWLPWGLQIAIASLALPLLAHPENLGFGDWDHHLQKFEAIRRTILIWHQFPWWTPWCRGGFPLASEPECGVVSVATPLVLLLGTSTGLRLATVLCLMIAVEGARRLAWHWFREPWSAALAGLVYGINGGVLVYTVAGHFIPMSYCALPWLLYHAFRIGDRLVDGLALGFWAAFDVLNGIQYPSVYALIITAIVWIRAFRVQPVARRGRLIAHTVAALGVGLALAGWRLATTALVLRDYPRVWTSWFDESPRNALGWMLNRPGPAILSVATSPWFWESACYVGLAVLLLALAGLRHQWRWWHTFMFLGFWLALGSMQWYQPSYWLAQGPVFKTMHVVTRWRIPAMLGLGLAAGWCVARWRSEGNVVQRVAAAVLVLGVAADYLAYGHLILPVASSIEPRENRFPGPASPRLVNVEISEFGYAAILRGYGVIRAHEPLLGYDRMLPTARLWRGHPQYRGEAWTDGAPLTTEFWSPNRIVYQTRPGQMIQINQNPGSWWLVNGQPAFPTWKCAEWTQPFVARADSRGRLELRIAPKGLTLGYGLHAAGIALALGAVVACRVRPEPSVR